ncbi:MAG: DUF433 domain-containing protein [Rhodoglobus sp.]
MTAVASRLDRIAVEPEIMHGKPRIRGTRVTVQVILELLSAGETIDELLGSTSNSPVTMCSPRWSTPRRSSAVPGCRHSSLDCTGPQRGRSAGG